MKWCTKLRVVYRRYSIVLQGHLANSNDTGVTKITDLIRISMFLDNPSSNARTELINEAQRFDGHRGHAHYFSWSPLNFQCHVGQTRSVGQLLLSNLSDVPYLQRICQWPMVKVIYGTNAIFFRSHVLFATHHPLCNTNRLLAGYFHCLQHI